MFDFFKKLVKLEQKAEDTTPNYPIPDIGYIPKKEKKIRNKKGQFVKGHKFIGVIPTRKKGK